MPKIAWNGSQHFILMPSGGWLRESDPEFDKDLLATLPFNLEEGQMWDTDAKALYKSITNPKGAQEWVLMQNTPTIAEQAATAGVAPVKTGQGTSNRKGAKTMPVTTPQNALSEADLYGQYLNQFNIPAFGASPFQKWQARQAAPTLGAYVLQSQQNPNVSLADYLGQTGIMGARQQLPGAYNALMANPDRGAVDWARQSLGELWNDVMGGVASAKYGRFFGPQLAQAMPQMQRQFEATPAGFEAPGESSFLDYLRQKYGI